MSSPRIFVEIQKCVSLRRCCAAQGNGRAIRGVPKLINSIEAPHLVLAGERAELRCQFELTEGEAVAKLYVKWWLIDDDNDPRLIYQRFHENSPQIFHSTSTFSMAVDKNDTIVFEPAGPLDSKVYECEVSVGDQEARCKHTLVVYTPGLPLQLNVTLTENDTLLAECSVDGASPRPELVIRMDGRTAASTADSAPSDNLNGTWAADVTAVVEAADAALFECELHFEDPDIPSYLAKYDYSGTGGVNVDQNQANTQQAETIQNVTETHTPQGNFRFGGSRSRGTVRTGSNSITIEGQKCSPGGGLDSLHPHDHPPHPRICPLFIRGTFMKAIETGDGCEKPGTTILMPAALILLQLMHSLQQYL
ncbi:hypothetical protein EVAR_13586_1 [Eumeta japonica]|uniref:Ig-like domain-containing protein n=1 Tax=Eumeta variegata TaxID=151549 RepID=A0A4C1U8T3_EUMVA|nr:hypothetical protein EVAR_13586_1 [Eumeta japonica]